MKKIFLASAFILISTLANAAQVIISSRPYNYLWNPFTGTQQYVTSIDTRSITGSGVTVTTTPAGVLLTSAGGGGGSLPPGNTNYIQNTLTPTISTQTFNVSTGVIANATISTLTVTNTLNFNSVGNINFLNNTNLNFSSGSTLNGLAGSTSTINKVIFMGSMTVVGSSLTMKSGGDFRMYDADNSNYSGFLNNVNRSANVAWSLPTSLGGTRLIMQRGGTTTDLTWGFGFPGTEILDSRVDSRADFSTSQAISGAGFDTDGGLCVTPSNAIGAAVYVIKIRGTFSTDDGCQSVAYLTIMRDGVEVTGQIGTSYLRENNGGVCGPVATQFSYDYYDYSPGTTYCVAIANSDGSTLVHVNPQDPTTGGTNYSQIAVYGIVP